MRKILFTLLVLSLSTLGAKEIVTMFHAGSLNIPFAKMEKAFEAKYPQYDLQREASGSRAAANKIVEIGKHADIMASADYTVIDKIMMPDYAKFVAKFATNELVLAYTNKSKYANKINSKNWTDIVLKKGVMIGHSNPNLDPCGYRSMIVTKLAAKYYNKPNFFKDLLGYGDSYENGEEKKTHHVMMRPKETDLVSLLQAGAFDYLYIYKSVAIQHHLKYVTFPDKINLKSEKYANNYKKASYKVTGKKKGQFAVKKGGPIVYGITMVETNKFKTNKKGAKAFINFLLSAKGQSILKSAGQTPMKPVIVGDSSSLK